MKELIRITLEWKGPFSDYSCLPDESGIDAVTSQVYGAASIQLIYIGRAKLAKQRWRCPKHQNWFDRHKKLFGARLYFASLDIEHLNAVENLLIYVHQPNQNTSSKSALKFPYRLIVSSEGAVPVGLLNVIDAGHQWFGLNPELPWNMNETPDQSPKPLGELQ